MKDNASKYRICKINPSGRCEECKYIESCPYIYCNHISCNACRQKYLCPMCSEDCSKCKENSICEIHFKQY